MNAHEKSSASSCKLCDLLLSSVQGNLRGVVRSKATNWCSFGITTKFAFIRHRRDAIRIYLRARESDGPDLKALIGKISEITLQVRGTSGSAWAQSTYYFLDVETEAQIRAATPLLLYAAGKIKQRPVRQFLLPSEEAACELIEGNRVTVQVSRVERDPKAREKCISIFGPVCSVCGFDFERTYGEIGKGFIHVHHLIPLASSKGQHTVDPKMHLRPVCPNCHEMLHRRNPPISIEALAARIKR